MGSALWLTPSLRNPFNDRIVASASEDGKVFIWEVPQNFTLYTDAEEITDVSPVSKLSGHPRYAYAGKRPRSTYAVH